MREKLAALGITARTVKGFVIAGVGFALLRSSLPLGVATIVFGLSIVAFSIAQAANYPRIASCFRLTLILGLGAVLVLLVNQARSP